MLVGSVVLDLIGQPTAADIALVADDRDDAARRAVGPRGLRDTDGTARTRATLHATLMVVALVVADRVGRHAGAGGAADRPVPIVLSIIGLLLVTAGAFVGGDVVYVLGNMVSRHAFRGAGTKWIRLDTGDVTDLAAMPEATPTKMRAGINDLVVVRLGDGSMRCMPCAPTPADRWTRARSPRRLPAVPVARRPLPAQRRGLRRGPSVYDQPAYEVRATDAGGYEVRRATS